MECALEGHHSLYLLYLPNSAYRHLLIPGVRCQMREHFPGNTFQVALPSLGAAYELTPASSSLAQCPDPGLDPGPGSPAL